jgi:PAS domain S-box-containing protein
MLSRTPEDTFQIMTMPTPVAHAVTQHDDLDFGVLFDATPAPYLVLSPQLTILAANAAYLQIAGRTRASIIGLNIFEAFPANPDDPQGDGVASLSNSLQQALATGRPDKIAAIRYDIAPDANGKQFLPRYWKTTNTPLLAADGSVRCIIHTVEEITSAFVTGGREPRDVLANVTDLIRELKAPEDIGQQAAAILGAALGASRVGYGAIDVARDTLHVVRDWCAAGVDTLAGETPLHHYSDFIDDLKLGKLIVIGNVDDDARTASAATALRARSAAAFVNVPIVERGVLVAVLFVNGASPRDWTVEELLLIKEVAARIHTAGERLRVAAALRESEAKFRTIADAMPQMVWSTLPDGYHDYYNEQWYRFTGVPPNSTDGDGWNDIFHPDDQDRAWLAWRASLATGNTYEIEYRLRHHGGGYRWVLGRALPVRNEDGAIIRWMGTCTDIENQKQAEATLREANGRKDEFLAMLAHELRNPLAPISSAAQIMLLRHGDPLAVQKSGQVILRQVRHLTALVDDLLDVSRVTHGLIRIERVPLDLQEVLQDAVEQAQPLIESRGHRLTLDLALAPCMVLGDKLRLVQVVANLLNNATKYTPAGGAIIVSLTRLDGQARIAVTDNGCGIEPALLPHVFDLFIQAKRTPERQQGGLGLGLALVKRITALHDGIVSARSDGPGLGSCFTMLLPLF